LFEEEKRPFYVDLIFEDHPDRDRRCVKEQIDPAETTMVENFFQFRQQIRFDRLMGIVPRNPKDPKDSVKDFPEETGE
jgi:hypothetical protein